MEPGTLPAVGTFAVTELYVMVALPLVQLAQKEKFGILGLVSEERVRTVKTKFPAWGEDRTYFEEPPLAT